MGNPVKAAVVVLVVVALAWAAYHVVPMGVLFYYMHSQMKAGQRCTDSITEKEIGVWIERTERYLQEYDPNGHPVGVYGMKENKPIPDELKALKILRIDVWSDQVNYVWLGGLDHTCLVVERTEDRCYKFTACYNDYRSRVIWPKEPEEKDKPAND